MATNKKQILTEVKQAAGACVYCGGKVDSIKETDTKTKQSKTQYRCGMCGKYQNE